MASFFICKGYSEGFKNIVSEAIYIRIIDDISMNYIAVIMMILLVACAKAPVEKADVTEKAAKPVAVLAVQSGMAVVNGNPASPGLELHEGDIVATQGGAKVSIVFFDSTVLRLDENTEVEVKRVTKDTIELKQATGQTWSRILKVSGIQDYKIETPNTVATVRGTGFAVEVSDGDTKIMVKEGKVHVASYENDRMMAEAFVSENMEMEVVMPS